MKFWNWAVLISLPIDAFGTLDLGCSLLLTIGLEPIRVAPTDFKSVVFTISPSEHISGYRLKVDCLPSKQKIWVRFPLSAYSGRVRSLKKKIMKLKSKKFRSLISQASSGKSSHRTASSSFGKRLESRRLFALLYGNISSAQYARLFLQARAYPGKIGMNFLSLVEKRLDVVVTKMFLFPSLSSARQYISHTGILVNNKSVNISSAFVHPGDILQIKDPSRGGFSLAGLASQPWVKHPHLEVNYKTLTGIFLFSPHQIYYRLPRLQCTSAGISMSEALPG
jgi:small subunit ribosomal protein S4